MQPERYVWDEYFSKISQVREWNDENISMSMNICQITVVLRDEMEVQRHTRACQAKNLCVFICFVITNGRKRITITYKSARIFNQWKKNIVFLSLSWSNIHWKEKRAKFSWNEFDIYDQEVKWILIRTIESITIRDASAPNAEKRQ